MKYWNDLRKDVLVSRVLEVEQIQNVGCYIESYGEMGANPYLLWSIGNSDIEHERKFVASNEFAPVQLLEHLVSDEAWFVRESLAQNPSASAKLLAVLATDRSDSVRWEVAKNANTARDSLALLMNDSHSFIQLSAMESIERLNQITYDEYGEDL